MKGYLPTKFFICHAIMLLFLLWTGAYHASAQTAQSNPKVTLIGQNLTIKNALKSLRQQTGLRFQYEDGILEVQKRSSPNFRDEPLPIVLDFLFEGTNIVWKISENNILLKKNEAVTPGRKDRSEMEQPNFEEVRGTVKDAAGGVIAGATVQVKGSTKGTTTNVDGHFSLSDIRLGSVIIISTLGYETREVEVKAPSILIGLNLDIRKLDETVIVGYGTTTKRFNTGNVSTVKGSDIQKQPITNPLQALQARVPGMMITQQTGLPGGGFNVQIRGQNSLRVDGNKPLYIIDGVPYSSTMLPGTGYSIIGDGNPLNYINPVDIESIDVLKDADATAIYGSRGANGVVLITTKKGTAGKTKIDINVYRGIGMVTRKLDLLNTPQYLEMRRQGITNDGASPDPAMDPDLLVWDTTRYTDWQKEMIGGTAQITDIQGSISGGTENVQYLLGGGFHRETTVFPGNFADQKGNVHFNINASTPNKKFKARLSASYMADINNLSNTDFTNNILEAPNSPVPYKADGSLNWEDNTWSNPYALLLTKFRNSTNNLVSNSVLSYQVVPGLELKTSLGYTNMQVREIVTYPIAAVNPAFGMVNGSALFGDNNISSWIVEPQVDYKKEIGNGNLNVLVGMTIQQNRSVGTTLYADGYTDDALLESLRAATYLFVQNQTNILYKYNAAFARVNYNYLGRYILNLTGRRDGSSRFGPGRQFANFGAIGAAWIFTEENSIKRALPAISFGKLRGSYGTAGNDQIGDYGFMSLFNPNQYPYQGAPGLYPINLVNRDFAWEINKKLEFGLEFGLFKDRVLVNTSYFRNRSSNQLVGRSLPPSTGFNSIVANLPAVVQNSGWEFVLDTRNIISRNFSWSTSFNLSILRNKLVSYPGIEGSDYQYVYVVGQPLSIEGVYNAQGVDPETGQYMFLDYKGNLTANPEFTTDRTVLINKAPKYFGGLLNSLQYKGFQLDLLLQFVKQDGRNFRVGRYPGTFNNNQPTSVLDRWQQQGDRVSIQRYNADFSLAQSFDYANNSSLSFSDASFIRLKNIALSWQFPESLKNKIGLQNGRFYLQGQNVLTITNYLGLDPENQSFTNLPPLSVWTVGCQLTF